MPIVIWGLKCKSSFYIMITTITSRIIGCFLILFCIAVKAEKDSYYRGNVMAIKTDAEVIIAGKVLTLCGYESEEYLQKVASYLNNKLTEYSKVDSYKRQPVDLQNILVQLNIADDYFKAKKQVHSLEDEIQLKEKELYDLKHQLIATQMKLESTEKSLKLAQNELNDCEKKVIRLETELKENKIK